MIFSADIEDWQQSVYDFDRSVSKRVVYNTEQLLEILAEHDVQGTFFVQGMVAEAFPQLIQSIAKAGHELACHSQTHRPLYTLTQQQFDEELKRSIGVLEQTSGQAILGFRAPTFSVRKEALAAYCDSLLKHNIRYDSSIMLANVRKIYCAQDESMVEYIESRGLDCYPMTTTKIMGKHLPVMGGGYFRLYPYWLTRLLSHNLDKQHSIFYMHPYELDAQEYNALKGELNISKKQALHQFTGRKQTKAKLHKLLNDYPFTSFKQQYYSAASDKPSPHAHGYNVTQQPA